MPRRKKVDETGAALTEEAMLRQENERLKAQLAKLKPKRAASKDGAVTFKSQWPRFQQRIRPARRIQAGTNGEFVMEPPIYVEFQNQVVTLFPRDTFEDLDGVQKPKIEKMREILRHYAQRQRRPNFIEVTDDQDLKIQTFRDRIPPAQLVEFRGPLVHMPSIPEPPPEARETLEAIEAGTA